MIEAMYHGLLIAFSPMVFLVSLAGILAALFIGILPGIGAISIMAIMLPLTVGWDPTVAIALMIALQAVGVTGGSITAVLIGVPGTGANAATIIDGYPMTKRGEGARAMSAALTASALGGVFGGIVLALSIPVAYQMIMAFGSGEVLLVSLFGLTLISTLSGGGMMKGLVSAAVGLMIGYVGVHSVSGSVRYTFGSMYLYEGLGLIPVIMGLFAIPAVFDMIMKKGGSISDVEKEALKNTGFAQVWQGMWDVIRHWKLFLRSSAIGTIIGIIPGVGADAAIFIAYGQAKKTSKNPETFGKGNIEGVIAPESANNSKEGGSMLPTLAFGIPGSAVMAVVLVAMLLHGIEPGPGMLREHLDMTWALIWILIISNILGSLILLPFLKILGKIAFIPARLMVPGILGLTAFSAYASRIDVTAVLVTFIFALLGWTMEKWGYNRVSLLLGFILGPMVERYYYIASEAMGFGFLFRPVALVLCILIVATLASGPISALFRKRKSLDEAPAEVNIKGSLFITFIFLAVLVTGVVVALPWSIKAKVGPFLVGIPGVLLCLGIIASEMRVSRKKTGNPAVIGSTTVKARSIWGEYAEVLLTVSGLLAAIYLLGLIPGIVVTTFLYLKLTRHSWLMSIAQAVIAFAFFYGVFYVVMGITLYQGIFFQ